MQAPGGEGIGHLAAQVRDFAEQREGYRDRGYLHAHKMEERWNLLEFVRGKPCKR